MTNGESPLGGEMRFHVEVHTGRSTGVESRYLLLFACGDSSLWLDFNGKNFVG